MNSMNSSSLSGTCDLQINASDAYHFQRSYFEKIFLGVVSPSIMVLGVTFNSAFLLVLSRMKDMQTLTNVYLGNLAVADIYLLMFIGVLNIITYVNSPQYNLGGFSLRSTWGCQVTGFRLSGFFASMFFLTAVMFDRYMAICHPLKHRLIQRKDRIVKIVATIWVVSICASLFFMQISKSINACISQFNNIGTQKLAPMCHEPDPIQWLFLVGRFLDFGAVTFNGLFQIFMISSILKVLRSRQEITTNEVSRASSTQVNSVRQQVMRMLITNSLIFFLCLTPIELYNVTSLITYIMGYPFPQQVLVLMAWCGRVLIMVNSTINPVVYNMTNNRYRAAFLQVFCRCGSRSQVRNPASSSVAKTEVSKI